MLMALRLFPDRLVSLLLAGASLAVISSSTATAETPKLPAVFEQNQGQIPEIYSYLVRANGYTAGVMESGITFVKSEQGRTHAWSMELDGARHRDATGIDPRPGRSSYFTGGKSIIAVPHFSGVRVNSVYPGIDLLYHASEDRLEYDFHVAPAPRHCAFA